MTPAKSIGAVGTAIALAVTLLALSGTAAPAGQRHKSYDYNAPLPFPPYGYTPGFWGYGGKRYYDKFGNYTKYGQGDGPDAEDDVEPIETIPRSRLR